MGRLNPNKILSPLSHKREKTAAPTSLCALVKREKQRERKEEGEEEKKKRLSKVLLVGFN